jgi:CheY-like chemotaxis protein
MLVNCAWPIGKPQPGSPTILVAEDQILLRMAIADELRKRGFNVAEAANADEALSILHSGVPVDLVLTDIKMSGTEGGESLAATIQAEYPEVKVVLASAQFPDQLGHEVDGFVRKPYEASEVAAIIKALLEQ